jgi:hypothetical protein
MEALVLSRDNGKICRRVECLRGCFRSSIAGGIEQGKIMRDRASCSLTDEKCVSQVRETHGKRGASLFEVAVIWAEELCP